MNADAANHVIPFHPVMEYQTDSWSSLMQSAHC